MNNTIYDYLRYYKETSFEKIIFNQMDALVFSILIYLPFKETCQKSTIGKIKEHLDLDNKRGSMFPVAFKILELVYNSKRYKDIIICNIEDTTNNKIQFGAMTLRYKNNAYVVFEGTNSSTSGWMENFRLSCDFPTQTQEKCIEYLNKTIKSTDKKIYICGHSKGGNLAMTSAMLCKDRIFNRIEKIYNFDGPGFRQEEYNSHIFNKIKEKTVNILPEGSVVGIMLFNDNYKYVKAKGLGFKQHNPINWYIFGEFFVESKILLSSKKLKQKLDQSLIKLNDKDMRIILNEVDRFLNDNQIYEKSFKNIDFNEFKKMINDINEVDEDTKKVFIDTIKLFFNPDKKSR